MTTYRLTTRGKRPGMRLKLHLFFISIAIFHAAAFAQDLAVKELSCEYQNNPLAVDVLIPRLSWKLVSPSRNVLQAAYELRVGSSLKDLPREKNIVWHTGKIKSGESVHIPYAGHTLQSGKRYYWQVRVWDQRGKASGWSEINYWQMGLLHPADWAAKWITTSDADAERSPMFRRAVSLKKEIRSATAYITAKGLYEAHINGTRVGDYYFTPGWTSYNKRLQYQAYDVSGLLKKGSNAIAVVLGGGWYRGSISKNKNKYWYGNDLGLLLQIDVEYTDGSREIIHSDETWRSSFGPILYSDIYNGETYDARQEKTGWTESHYQEDSSWNKVNLLAPGTEKLIGMTAPPVRMHEEFKVLKIIQTPKGETVVDFGQNLVGWVRLKAKGAAGTTITVSHAEVLDKAGNFYTENLRAAKQQNIYILKGNKEGEEFEPHFTFQGFRYVKIEGYPGKLEPSHLTAIALYSDLKLSGTISTSNALLNQLQHNIVWGQKGNFLDIPTDCNQRDERLGWTGDASPFFRTASFNMDVAGFFTKWLSDLKADQHENGSVPYVIPNVRNWGSGVAGWDDAATIIPWDMYLIYGDKRILENQYESMKAWVNYVAGKSTNYLWSTGFQFGDWLSYWPEDELYGKPAVTDKYLIAQAFFVHSTQLLVNTAELLGKKADAEQYKVLLGNIKHAFQTEYLTPGGRLVSDTQTAYVLALNFDILPEDQRAQAAKRLAENIKAYGHLTTGFLGTPYLCLTLSRFGYTDLAYTLLLREKYPSWLYQVKMGATTIWERWDGIKADSTLQNPEMNSFNHYHYGVIGEWMYRVMAGIDTDVSPEGVGYKMTTIAPQPGGNLKSASATLTTLYGKIISAWTMEDGNFKLDLTIPANTTAKVYLPGAVLDKVKENNTAIANMKEISDVSQNKTSLAFTVGSGTYHFEYNF